MKLKLKDAPTATLLYVEEAMNTDKFNEIRRTYYTKRDGDPYLEKFLPAYAIAIVQGCLWRPYQG
jgi:hypothetical protein